MRSYLFNIFLGSIACFILIFSFIHESQSQVNKNLGLNNPPPPAHLQEEGLKKIPVHSQYQLPAPGILPTNPFYLFKMVRDRVGLLLTLEPDQHALLLLHYADKRLAAAETLAAVGHETEAVETTLKAEAYLLQAIHASSQISVNLRPDWFDNLKRALLKHEEIIEEISATAKDSQRDQLDRLHQNLDVYRQEIVALTHEPFGYTRPEDAVHLPLSLPSPLPSATPQAKDIPYI